MKNSQYLGSNDETPVFIGNNALNINEYGMYTLILKSHADLITNKNILPKTKMHTAVIQRQYLDLINQENIIITGVPIKFSDNTWDFSELSVDGKHINIYRYHFNGFKIHYNLPNHYIILLKLYMWTLISEFGIHHTSNFIKFGSVRRFLSELSKRNINSLRELSLKNLVDIFESKVCNYNSMIKQKKDVMDFFLFYSSTVENIYTDDFSDYFQNVDMTKMKAIIESKKTPLLPTNFYRKFSQILFDYAMDNGNPLKERGLAGLLYIGTQTGLRTSELTIIKVGCIEKVYFEDKQVNILHYSIVKNCKNGKYLHAETIASNKVIEMVDTLSLLFVDYRNNKEYLVPFIRSTKAINKNISKNTFAVNEMLMFDVQFCIKYCRELGILNTEERHMFAGSYSKGKVFSKDITDLFHESGLSDNDVVSYPNIRQFRVYVATELRERGYSDRLIASLYHHETIAMLGAYCREFREAHEDPYFKTVIPESLLNPSKNLSHVDSKKLEQAIDSFLAKDIFNTTVDVRSLINSVDGEYPIVLERGGLCVKPGPSRICHKSMDVDTFKYIFGLASHSNLYFIAPDAYHIYKQLVATIEYNQIHNFINQTQKELFKLEVVINEELLPNIQDLEKELISQGKDILIDTHPDLAYIIEHLDDIKEDIQSWNMRIKELY
jgi:hypothetical protein